MNLCSCDSKRDCVTASIIASIVLGVAAILLQLTGVMTLIVPNAVAVFYVAAAYLGVLLLISGIARPRRAGGALRTLLVGIVGTLATASVFILRAVGFSAVVSAILIGVLITFVSLTVFSAVCYVKRLAGPEE